MIGVFLYFVEINVVFLYFCLVVSGRLMFVSTLIYAVSFVIYAYILFAVLPNDIKIYGVHIALSIAYITEVIFAAIMYFSGRWKSPEYKKIEAEASLSGIKL